MNKSDGVVSDAYLSKLLSGPLDPSTSITRYTGEQLFDIDSKDLAKAQLAILRRRFEELAPQLPALKKLADNNRITELNSLDDVVPLLFPHTMHKSYPMSLIANCRFDLMNEWLNDFTVHDLSSLDVSKAQTIDEWLDIVEANTPARLMVSSGTSGKCSLLPKSVIEYEGYPSSFAATFSSYGDEPGVDDFGKTSRYHIMPRTRHSRHNTGHVIKAWIAACGGDESHVYSLGGELSTDVLWLTGQMRKAQADGTFEKLKKSAGWKRVNGRMQEMKGSNRVPLTPQEFAKKVLEELNGKSVMSLAGNAFLWSLIECSEKYGYKIEFQPTSLFFLAGGAKLDMTTPEQRAKIHAQPILRTSEIYGFGELTHAMRKCAHNHYHPPPWVISFLLDRDTGEAYPRSGVRTGRYAAFDTWGKTYWAGFITGDEATMNWDGGCPCGRKGAYLHGDVGRYTEKYGGDDKITCARTAAAVAEMMEYMRARED